LTGKPDGNYLALGVLADFVSGWARLPFVGPAGGPTHFWVPPSPRERRAWTSGVGVDPTFTPLMSLCGRQGHYAPTLGTRPLVPGNFPRCKHCQRRARLRVVRT
jgi:hypothetical protein